MIKDSIHITVIGAGKLAHSVVPAFIAAGYKIESIISRNPKDASELASRYGIQYYSETLDSYNRDSNFFLVSVPDSQLEIISADILRFIDVRKKYFIHFSGVMESGIFENIKDKGGYTASFHIIQTFPGKFAVPLKNNYCAVETSVDTTAELLFNIAESLGIKPFRLPGGRKTAYHLSAVFASNFLVSNLFTSQTLFNQAADFDNSYKLLEPIIMTTLDNIRKNGAADSISGPIERGDLVTVKMHIEYLRDQKYLLKSYIAQSLVIIEIKKMKGEFTTAMKKLEDYLKDELDKN